MAKALAPPVTAPNLFLIWYGRQAWRGLGCFDTSARMAVSMSFMANGCASQRHLPSTDFAFFLGGEPVTMDI